MESTAPPEAAVRSPMSKDLAVDSARELHAGLYREGWLAAYAGNERPTAAAIARLAYHFYETRGRQNGHDVEDWLLAEQELTQHYWLVADPAE